jgi:hypothetical protein
MARKKHPFKPPSPTRRAPRLPPTEHELEAIRQQSAARRASNRTGIDNEASPDTSHMNPNRGELLYQLQGSAHSIKR